MSWKTLCSIQGYKKAVQLSPSSLVSGSSPQEHGRHGTWSSASSQKCSPCSAPEKQLNTTGREQLAFSHSSTDTATRQEIYFMCPRQEWGRLHRGSVPWIGPLCILEAHPTFESCSSQSNFIGTWNNCSMSPRHCVHLTLFSLQSLLSPMESSDTGTLLPSVQAPGKVLLAPWFPWTRIPAPQFLRMDPGTTMNHDSWVSDFSLWGKRKKRSRKSTDWWVFLLLWLSPC